MINDNDQTMTMLRAALAPFADESIFAGPQHDYVTVARSACDAAKAALDATQQPITVAQACEVPEVKALIEALIAWKDAGTDVDYYHAVRKRNAAIRAIEGGDTLHQTGEG